METKVEQLRDWLSKQSACTVHAKRQADLRCYRFYFEKDGNVKWNHILDVYLGDLDEQDAVELAAHLTAVAWQQVLRSYSGRLIPVFVDKRFADPRKFHDWPEQK